MNVKVELTRACAELARAMNNAEAVRRYEAQLDEVIEEKWNNCFRHDLYIKRAKKLYDDAYIISGGHR